MITRRILLTILPVLIATAANAQSVKLTSSQIAELLTGNTAVGKWQGQRYRQFFDDEGQIIYAQQGARSSVGKWRIDTTIDEYQSVWPNEQEWEGWYVMEYAGDYYWVSKSTPPTPFRVEQGQQLTWPDAE
jgi:hypothetical protein